MRNILNAKTVAGVHTHTHTHTSNILKEIKIINTKQIEPSFICIFLM